MADAWSSSLTAFLLHSSFSFLCLSSSAEYMAFSSDRGRDNKSITIGNMELHYQTAGSKCLFTTTKFSVLRKNVGQNTTKCALNM